jgi:hypothetical protein
LTPIELPGTHCTTADKVVDVLFSDVTGQLSLTLCRCSLKLKQGQYGVGIGTKSDQGLIGTLELGVTDRLKTPE